MSNATHTRGWTSSLEPLWQDVLLALRMVRRSPGFAAIIILTLALGIGANAAIFGVVNGLLLRPLPVADPQRLVTISSDMAIGRGFPAGMAWSLAMWDRLQPHVPLFGGALAWMPARIDLSPQGEQQPAYGLFVSGDYFTTLGVPPLLGRTFTPADDRPGGGADGPIAVISYAFWQRRFGGDTSAIGARLVVDDVPVTIVGITPPGFFGVEVGQAFDVALPLQTEPLIHGDRSALAGHRLAVMLRLKPGQSADAATATIRGLQPRLLGVPPEKMSTVTPAPLREPFRLVPASTGTSGASAHRYGLRQAYERPLVTLFAIVLLVLLIACVNIAHLLLARATARRHELSVRLALGAPRARLARQLLLESLVLSALGAALGLLLAAWGSQTLVSQLSTGFGGVTLNLSIDWRMLAFTATVAVATAALFGVAPALRVTRLAPMDAVKVDGRATAHGVAGTGRRGRLSGGLVVFQIALSLALVITAGLFVRTFARLTSVPLGFDRDRVLVATVDTRRIHTDPAERLRLFHRLVDAVRGAPGVAHAGGSMGTPVDGGMRLGDSESRLAFNLVSPGWFAAYGTAFLAGRDFTARDTPDAPQVVIVNDAFVRERLRGRTPIGETISYPRARDTTVTRTIVGVVRDAVFDSQRDGISPIVYLPLAQSIELQPPTQTQIGIGIRAAAGSPMRLARGVDAVLTRVDPGVAFTFRPLAGDVEGSVSQERLVAVLSGCFGALALLLAALGLYGVTSHAVGRRSAEIGLRMALGAQRADVLRLVLGRSAALTGIGVLAGLASAAALTRYLRGMLFGLTPLDPATFISVSLLFVAVAAVAATIPARRATRVDPIVALRRD